MVNTKEEEAFEKLLENRGYILYNTDVRHSGLTIEGCSPEPKYYNFKIDIPLPIKVVEGKSVVDAVVNEIDKYILDIEDRMEKYTKKKEFKKKESSNEVLIEMFENGIDRVDSVRVSSEIIGRKQGKTSTIVYLAQKYNLPIVVSDNQYKELLYREDKELKVYNMKSVEGLNSKIVLVDELKIRHSLRLKEMGYIVIGIVR